MDLCNSEVKYGACRLGERIAHVERRKVRGITWKRPKHHISVLFLIGLRLKLRDLERRIEVTRSATRIM